MSEYVGSVKLVGPRGGFLVFILVFCLKYIEAGIDFTVAVTIVALVYL